MPFLPVIQPPLNKKSYRVNKKLCEGGLGALMFHEAHCLTSLVLGIRPAPRPLGSIYLVFSHFYLARLRTGWVIRRYIVLQSILRIQVRRISDCWMRKVT